MPDSQSTLRLDRMVSLFAVMPVLQRTPDRTAGRLSILMYHSISTADESRLHPYYRLCTSPERFGRQLLFLKENGYAVLPLDLAVEMLFEDRLKGKNVVLTFDDGFKDFHSEGFPLLKKFGFASTVFLPVEHVTNPAVRLRNREHLSWDEIRELSQSNVSFGSHTMTHRQLFLLDPPEIGKELRRSKEEIENQTGSPVRAFSYPFAFPETRSDFVLSLKNILQTTGYTCGVTTKIGNARPAQDRYFLHRLPVNSADDDHLFGAKLRGAYDWVHSFQYAKKWIKEKLPS